MGAAAVRTRSPGRPRWFAVTLLHFAQMDAAKIADRTTVGIFYRQADRYGERTLIHNPTDSEWDEVSWQEMARLARGVAAGLIERGVEPGDRVVLISENRLEWLYADFGIQTAGAVTVPVYPNTIGPVVESIAANAEAVAAIGSRRALSGKLEAGKQVRVVAFFEDDLPAWLKAEPSRATEAEIDRRLAGISPDDVSSIVYTSGTTGEPKGVVLLHRSFVDMARSSLEAFHLSEDDVELSFLPYAHVFERTSGIFVGISAGVTIWLSRGTDRLTEDLAEVRPTVMVAVPRVYEKMHEAVLHRVGEAAFHRRTLFNWAVARGRSAARKGSRPPGAAERWVLEPLRNRLTGGRLRFFVSGGAPLARDVEEFFWALGVRILNGWGLTETNSGATSNTETAHRYETVGRPLPGVELKIAEDGEILVRSPGNMVGYHRKPEATAEVLRDGWLYTGDVGKLDEDGFLRITDRKKDLIKTAGGKYVAPQMLEARLQEDLAIERAVVIGDQRPYVVALIVPSWTTMRNELGLQGSPEDLVGDERVRARIRTRVNQVNAEVGSWETVKEFIVLPRDFTEESGELTPTLKVKRPLIERNHRDEIEALYTGGRRPAATA